MKFTALPVNEGDAFLLQSDDLTVLTDGGNNSEVLIKLLHKALRKKRIDILICTHYDGDHYKGVIGLIQSGEFSIGEIWLPEIIGSIGYTIKKSYRNSVQALRKLPEFTSPDIYADKVEQIKMLRNAEVTEEEFERTMGKTRFPPPIIRPDPLTEGNLNEFQENVLTQFYQLSNLTHIFYASGTLIRWFRHENGDRSVRVHDYPLYAMNGVETSINFLADPTVLLYAVSLTVINHSSLNFKYDKGALPEVLFTGDSDLRYRSTSLMLRDRSVVTAPHHGAESAGSAYARIAGVELTYVRSDRSSRARPCAEYLALPNRYCTICRGHTHKQDIVLQWNKRKKTFLTTAKTCHCK
jgi:hypothetical protein